MRFKKQVEILRDMIGYTSATTGSITDFTIGSGARTMYDSFSIELQELYMLTQSNIREGIEAGLMSAYSFVPKSAQRAYGYFRVTFTEPISESVTIARGTILKSSKTNVDVIFETLVDYIVPEESEEIIIIAYCTEAGVVGNVDKGDIDVLPYTLYKVDGVTNVEDILTGSDEASYEATKKLFKLFIESRGRGTKKALEYGALSVNEISGAYVDERVGVNFVYCHDQNGNLPTDVYNKVVRALEDYRPAGIETKVLPIVKYSIDLDFTVVMNDPTKITPIFTNKVESFIKTYLNSFVATQDLVLSEFIQEVMNLDDLAIYDCYFDELIENVIVEPNEIIRAGEINLTFK